MKDIDSGMGQRAVGNRLGVSQSMLSKWIREYKKGDFDDRNRLDMRARDRYWPVDARAVDKDVLAEIKKKMIAHTILSELSQEIQSTVGFPRSQDAAVKPEGMSEWAPPAVGEDTTWKPPPLKTQSPKKAEQHTHRHNPQTDS